MGKDAADSAAIEKELDSSFQRALLEYMEELQLSAIEARWFAEGDAIGDGGQATGHARLVDVRR